MKTKGIIFKVMAIFLPVLALVILEIFLRLSGYGFEYCLFLTDPVNPENFIANTEVSNRFFNNESDARVGIATSFKKEKPDNAFRVVVLGGSSALGYPYTERASFPRMLKYRIESACPDKAVEMINLSITAVNSYALLSFASEVSKINPDAVLIYAGHNEYYGALGVGSTQKVVSNLGLKRLLVQLKRFKVFQLVLNTAQKIRSSNPPKNDKGFMSRMAKEQEIDYGSDLYFEGIQQFESNMNRLLRLFNQKKIPVYLSAIVSNEKDLKPFTSINSLNIDSIAFNQECQLGSELLTKGDSVNSINHFLNALKLDSCYAKLHFDIGNIYYGLGDYLLARKYYQNARKYDALRFRAPVEINECIEHLANKYTNTHFVETESFFRNYAPNGIIGKELIIDQLHPTLKGYFILSEAFFSALINNKQLTPGGQMASASEAWCELPVCVIDSIYGDWMCKIMKRQWPFFEELPFDPDGVESVPERFTKRIFSNAISYDQALDSLQYFYAVNRNEDQLLKLLISRYFGNRANDWPTIAEIASIYREKGNSKIALRYFKKAFEVSQNIVMARQVIIEYLSLDSMDEIPFYLDKILENEPYDLMAQQLKEKLKTLPGYFEKLKTDSSNCEALAGLSDYYLFIGNTDMAGNYLSELKKDCPNDSVLVNLELRYRKLKN